MTREEAKSLIPAIAQGVVEQLLPTISKSSGGGLSDEDKRRLVDEIFQRLEMIHLPGFVRRDEIDEVRRLIDNQNRELAGLRKQINGGSAAAELPVGGERVTQKVRELHPDDISDDEAIAKAVEAFKAIGRQDPDAAIQWLEDMAAEESPEAKVLPKDATEISELIAAGLGYRSFTTAKSQREAIKKLAVSFVRRSDDRRTPDKLNSVIANAVAAGQLRLKRS